MLIAVFISPGLASFSTPNCWLQKTSEERNLGAVGSLNFTRRGFLGNEESIFFEDKESSPFNFKLGLPENVLLSVSNIHSILEAKTSDNVSILKMLNIETNKKTPGWKKYCINTCYGYWCPKQLMGEVIKNINDGVKSKRDKLKPILSKNGKDKLKNDYICLFNEVENKTRELGCNWDKDKAIQRLIRTV